MIFYNTITSEVKFRLILNSVQCSFQRNVKWGQVSGTFFIDGLQTPYADKPFASWMVVNLLVRNDRGGTLINLSKEVTKNKSENFCCRSLPRSPLYFEDFPLLMKKYFKDIVFSFRGYIFVFSSVKLVNLWRLKFTIMNRQK